MSLTSAITRPSSLLIISNLSRQVVVNHAQLVFTDLGLRPYDIVFTSILHVDLETNLRKNITMCVYIYRERDRDIDTDIDSTIASIRIDEKVGNISSDFIICTYLHSTEGSSHRSQP